MNLKKIIIFGGSFDPIHNGHIKAAKIAAKAIGASKVFFTPTYAKITNNHTVSKSQHRLKMVQLAIKDYSDFSICRWDINNKNLYTINLLKHFKKRFKNAEIYLLIGADQVNNFSNWNSCNEISNLVRIIFVQRAGVKLNKQNIKKYQMECVGNTDIEISSSQLRYCSSRKYMNSAVVDYINNNLLYTNERIKQFLSTKRWQHCLSTAKFAKKLAKTNGYHQPNDAYIAGLFHDVAKEFSKDKLLKYSKREGVEKYTSIETLHPIAGYSIMKREYLFSNQDILQAVYRHTEPVQKNLTLLDKIIYVADKCEPLRKKAPINNLFNVSEMQAIAIKDVNRAFKLIFTRLKQFYNSDEFKRS